MEARDAGQNCIMWDNLAHGYLLNALDGSESACAPGVLAEDLMNQGGGQSGACMADYSIFYEQPSKTGEHVEMLVGVQQLQHVGRAHAQCTAN